jgi:hypothetical protein
MRVNHVNGVNGVSPVSAISNLLQWPSFSAQSKKMAQPRVADRRRRGWLGDGHHLAESVFDPQSVLDQDTPVRFGQRDSGTQLSAQDSILLAQIIIF